MDSMTWMLVLLAFAAGTGFGALLLVAVLMGQAAVSELRRREAIGDLFREDRR